MNADWEGGGKDRAVWFLVGCVFCCVILVVLAVFFHGKNKAQSPQALVAAALSAWTGVQEWKPGMGPQPFMYHPAASNGPMWQPLMICPQHGAVNFDQVDPGLGRPRCQICGQPMVFNSNR